MNNLQEITKECFGCGDDFTTHPAQNYDYCTDCAINNNRYVPGHFTKANCAECGDGSGWIKLGNQLRACKICALTKQ